MHLPNPDATPATVPPASKPFLSTPGGVAVVAGIGTLLVGGVVYAMTRSSGLASCAWVPAPKGYGSFGQPGHYRIDVGVPAALVAKVAANYPPSEQQWEQMLQQAVGHMPTGVTVEGIWLPAITVNGQTLGPYSYPPNTPMPSDWPVANDGLSHARMQLIWPFKSDILTGLLNSNSATVQTAIQQLGISLQVLSCPTGPVPTAVPFPLAATPVVPDASGNVTANPNDTWFVSSTPGAAPATLVQAVTAFTNAGFTALVSWDATSMPNDWPSSDSGARWRFIMTNTSSNPIVLPITSDEKVFLFNMASLASSL